MVITKRDKGNYGRTAVFTDKKVQMNFDINVLELMCSYVLSENAHITRAQLINMRNLFEAIDLTIYENDVEKLRRIRFIRRGLDARLIENLKNPTLILAYINGGIVDGDLDPTAFAQLDNSELAFVNETVCGALKCTFIENDMHHGLDIITRYMAQDYRSRDSIIKEWEDFTREQTSKFRRLRVETLNDTVFSLDSSRFENSISDIYDKVTSPSRGLKCCMQGLNDMLGGWFESSRFYLFLGLSGCGKSFTILDLALQMRKANRGFATKDPTKIPTILLLTQETDVTETVSRMFSMISGGKMSDYTKEDVLRILRTDGEMMLSGDNNINFQIVFKPDRSIDTGDLYTMIEDLEDDGYEVVCLFQDHIKKIRSAYKQLDLRIELGDVVNEMKILAQLKEIPVISVSHLNRDASRTIDEGVKGNKADLTRALGRSNVSESMLMIDNADWVTIINTEYDQEGTKYMAFKNVKMRYAAITRDCIFYPYEASNLIKLIEDAYSLVPVFRETLAPKPPTAQLNRSVNMKPSMYNNLQQMDDDEDDNIFNPTGSCYSPSGVPIQTIVPSPSTPRTIIPMSALKSSNGSMPMVMFYNEGDEDLYKVQ
jgi:hypothetical protein